MKTSGSDSQLPRDSSPVVIRRRPDGDAEKAVWLAVEAAIPSLASLQRSALSIYGRLEPERALMWTVEELGELAQAVRRGEGRARLEEELGQLTAWMLCLANILGVDLADAVQSAIREEIERQLVKYGKIVPYHAARRPSD
jgi:NTP pyrophosphatase (non-canonical NTP hydrolase)